MKMRMAIVCGLFLLAETAWGLDISQCGQTIPRHQTGVLRVDLDCPPDPQFCSVDDSIACTVDSDCPGSTACIGVGVYLEHTARLDLNGHTLKGGKTAAVWCERNCAVSGPGHLEGTTQILAYVEGNIEVTDVALEGGLAGIYTSHGGIRATNISANNGSVYGLYAYRTVRGTNITANGNGQWGIVAARVIGSDITANGNAIHGVGAYSVKVTHLIATDNGEKGVSCTLARLADSTLTGNGQFDILTKHRPRLSNTVCGRSARFLDPSSSWSVCQSD